ncbi:hypothetical protein HZH66_013089 [Vespula vulgaris]|uniref:Uncharacterized protein n=1 Tax=Vespula vulgaris TaxID=7454 RepID=A0A834J751_VESVU|nr:hypothetical protein HZH66_013089 [Vespula vulgaris]
MEFEKRVQRSTAGWSRKPQGKARGPTIGKQRCWWSALAGRKNGDAKVPFEDSYFPRSHGCHTSSAILRLSLHCATVRAKGLSGGGSSSSSSSDQPEIDSKVGEKPQELSLGG